MPPDGIKVLAFDVFGTVVDWRGTIVAEGERLSAEQGLRVDWGRFADAWRARYRPSMDRVMRGELPWTTLDALHRASLEDVLDELGVTGLSDAQKDELNHGWHRLRPWPDSVAGLRRLRERHILATLSNGNVRLLVDMARHSDLPWDCILSAELVRAYKPNPRVYQMAVELLAVEPHEVLMVAAHPADLRAAQAQGLRTAFVPRPLEYGREQDAELRPEVQPEVRPEMASVGSFDLVASDFVDLARQLG
jgi:2-haloacid dehalogenase